MVEAAKDGYKQTEILSATTLEHERKSRSKFSERYVNPSLMHIRRMRMTSSIQSTLGGVCDALWSGCTNVWRSERLPVLSCVKHRWIGQPHQCAAVTRHLMQQSKQTRSIKDAPNRYLHFDK